jgi:hypothetical protein
MFKKSHITGSIVLFLISLIVFLGCPTGGSTDTPDPEDPSGGSSGGGGGGGYMPTEDEAAKDAAAIAQLWGYSENLVSVSGSTITLNENLLVNGAPAPAASYQSRAAARVVGDPDVLGFYHVPNIPITAGITVRVPEAKKLKIQTSTPYVVTGTIVVEKGGPSKNDGELIVEQDITLIVQNTGKVIVNGKASGDGKIDLRDPEAQIIWENSTKVEVSVVGEGQIPLSEDDITIFSRGSEDSTYKLLGRRTVGEEETQKIYYNLKKISPSSDPGKWFSIPGNESSIATLLNEIYEPNAVDSEDDIEDGKTAIKYTREISEKVLNLFEITIKSTTPGTGYGSWDKVEITGTDLPTASGASSINLIIIDIGKPTEEGGTPAVAGTSKPQFYIPPLGLGDQFGNYSHIRLRVNPGKELVILTDNSGYISGGGVGDTCDPGYFNGGCVEVMENGKLRDGAYEGFPLGKDAVILNRWGSYLSIGPEPDHIDATTDVGGTNVIYNNFYKGYLVGPEAPGKIYGATDYDDTPRVVWGGTGGYLEVRPGKIATDAVLTVRKSLGLIYSVWFVNDASLTIDIPSVFNETSGEGNPKDNIFPNNKDNPTQWGHGLAANEFTEDFNFYGSTKTGSPTTITIKTGNFLDERFLHVGKDADLTWTATSGFIGGTGDITVTHPGTGTQYAYTDTIKGLAGWTVPELPTQ